MVYYLKKKDQVERIVNLPQFYPEKVELQKQPSELHEDDLSMKKSLYLLFQWQKLPVIISSVGLHKIGIPFNLILNTFYISCHGLE